MQNQQTLFQSLSKLNQTLRFITQQNNRKKVLMAKIGSKIKSTENVNKKIVILEKVKSFQEKYFIKRQKSRIEEERNLQHRIAKANQFRQRIRKNLSLRNDQIVSQKRQRHFQVCRESLSNSQVLIGNRLSNIKFKQDQHQRVYESKVIGQSIKKQSILQRQEAIIKQKFMQKSKAEQQALRKNKISQLLQQDTRNLMDELQNKQRQLQQAIQSQDLKKEQIKRQRREYR